MEHRHAFKDRISASSVLLAATSYPRDAADWQGRFIFDQAAALARQGVRLALWAPPGDLPPGVESALCPSDAQWLARLLARGGIAQKLRRQPLSGAWSGLALLWRLRAACRLAGADFYHINWMQNALALPADGRPALVTVLGSDFRLLDLPGMSALLRRQFASRRVILAPNAGWMAPALRERFGGVAEIRPIPFGVAPEWFDVARNPAATPLGWLVVSRVTRGKLGTLMEWGEGFYSEKEPLHLLGPLQDDLHLPPWIVHHGPTHPRELREKWFPRATGLLTLSQHDEGRPQVLIEAMAAGLPVVASDIAAHADLIRHGETGWLVGDRQGLAAALDEARCPAQAARCAMAASRFVREEIGTWDDCARRYCRAYADLLENRR